MIVNHNLTQSPGQVSVVDNRNGSANPLNATMNINGDWYMDKSSNNLYYIGKIAVVHILMRCILFEIYDLERRK